MSYAHLLVPTISPQWITIDGVSWPFSSRSNEELSSVGWLPLIYDPEGAPLGYADPVEETRDGHQVAVAYALGTEIERAAAAHHANWAASANQRKQREARRVAAQPLPSNATQDQIQARIDALNILTGA